jgi:hypothetical protein
MYTERVDGTDRFAALLLPTLTLLFALRVAGQVLQRWWPLSFLPEFHAFQGSRLPYVVLLPAQLVILALMLRISQRVRQGTLAPRARLGRGLAWAGWIYMTAALLRLAIGMSVPTAPAWFRTWIPGFFHLVLAGFVLSLAAYHQSRTRPSA